jgi:type III secretion protein L
MKKVIKSDALSAQTHLEDRVRAVPRSAPRPAIHETGGVLNRKTLDAREKAAGIIEGANQEADRIKADAAKVLAEVEAVREQAKKEGFAEGREEGLAQATELISKFEALKAEFYEKAEPEIISLVMEIAEKVVGRMVHDHREAIISIVQQAIESSLGDRITIRLNPTDFKKIQSQIKLLQESLDKTRRLVFKEDDGISQGGCVVETEVGMIDAQLETQLRAIRKALEI